MKSQELYELWDNALNYLLDELESSLSEEEFSNEAINCDYYANLEALCEDLDVDKEELVSKLAGIDYHYNSERNQFV